MVDMDLEVGRGQEVSRLLRPFDQDDGVFLKNVAKPCIQPLARVAKSIKIKVIEV